MQMCNRCKHKYKEGHEEPCVRCTECGVPYIEGSDDELNLMYEEPVYVMKDDVIALLAELSGSDAKNEYDRGWDNAITGAINNVREMRGYEIKMLEEYLQEYEKAIAGKEWKEVSRIERELASLGMDKLTLSVLIKERKKSRK